jgi:hypothetical protein
MENEGSAEAQSRIRATLRTGAPTNKEEVR